jgi:protein-tyrosine phosphatase
LARFVRKGFARVYEFFPSKLNFSWVTDQLAVGGAFRTSQIPRLKAMGVDAVIDCREEARDDAETLQRYGIDYLRLPTIDATALSQRSLDLGVEWARERLAQGDKIFVHCLHGVGRAPLMGSCILVDRGASPIDAMELIKSRRWQASPNEEQLDALIEYAERHTEPDGASGTESRS